MKILAIDTATERCSAALSIDGAMLERSAETPRAHADLILPMVKDLLDEAALRLVDLDGIAFGRGPGAFTGVRIAVGVAQGLAYGANLPTVAISNLAAVAQQVVERGSRILVCMDARMNEVYLGRYERTPEGVVALLGAEQVASPASVTIEPDEVPAGTGFKAYPQLGAGRTIDPMLADLLPRAREIAMLAAVELRAGRGMTASAAEPVYLRDQVVFVKSP